MKRFFEWFVTPLKNKDPLPSGEELRRRINQLIDIGVTPKDALVQLAKALKHSPAEVRAAMESPSTDTLGDSTGGSAAQRELQEKLWSTMKERLKSITIEGLNINMLIIAVAILVAVVIFCLGTRYQMVATAEKSPGSVYIYDRFSGKIWVVWDLPPPYAIPVFYVSDEMAK